VGVVVADAGTAEGAADAEGVEQIGDGLQGRGGGAIGVDGEVGLVDPLLVVGVTQDAPSLPFPVWAGIQPATKRRERPRVT